MKKHKYNFSALALSAMLTLALVMPGVSFAKQGADDIRPESRIKNELKRIFSGSPTSTTSTMKFLDIRREDRREDRQEDRVKLADDSAMRGSNFCNQIPTLGEKINKQISEREAELMKKRAESDKMFELRKGALEIKLSEHRGDWDDNFSRHFSLLESRATTDAQKAAVAKFRATVESAAKERRAAIDAVIGTFSGNVATTTAAHKAKVDEAVRVYKAALDSATAKAKADCTATPANEKTIREAYRTALKVAKEKFNADMKAIEKIRSTVNALSADHKAAIQRANEAFKVKVQSALTELKAAFPQA
jgi:hypothetical protein